MLRPTIVLDGVRMKIEPPDLDGDGKIGGTEILRRQDGTIDITQSSEMGESIRELNSDDIDPVTKQSAIDKKTRIDKYEEMFLLIVDSLRGFKFLPAETNNITTQKKRLAISRDGRGRDEIVRMVVGDREYQKERGTVMDKARRMFK